MRLIAGLDEVGQGALAGCLVIAAVAFPAGPCPIPGVRDSKKCRRWEIWDMAPHIVDQAAYVGVGFVQPWQIDKWGLSSAWQYAANMALHGIPDCDLIVDGRVRVRDFKGPQKAEPKADDTYWQVSAASIVAKRSRDGDMLQFAEHYPEYMFEHNVGYGSKDHIEAIVRYGLSPIHRRNFCRKLMTRVN